MDSHSYRASLVTRNDWGGGGGGGAGRKAVYSFRVAAKKDISLTTHIKLHVFAVLYYVVIVLLN